MSKSNFKTKTVINNEEFFIPSESLDPVTFTRIVQQIDKGDGDYTKEKYKQPEITREEIKSKLKIYK